MKRYCGPCDEWLTGKECPRCGADTDAPVKREPTKLKRKNTIEK